MRQDNNTKTLLDALQDSLQRGIQNRQIDQQGRQASAQNAVALMGQGTQAFGDVTRSNDQARSLDAHKEMLRSQLDNQSAMEAAKEQGALQRSMEEWKAKGEQAAAAEAARNKREELWRIHDYSKTIYTQGEENTRRTAQDKAAMDRTLQQGDNAVQAAGVPRTTTVISAEKPLAEKDVHAQITQTSNDLARAIAKAQQDTEFGSPVERAQALANPGITALQNHLMELNTALGSMKGKPQTTHRVAMTNRGPGVTLEPPEKKRTVSDVLAGD